jgi:hypothetical protein
VDRFRQWELTRRLLDGLLARPIDRAP